MADNNLIPFDVIQAAVAGESWAVEKVVEHYEDYITNLCMYDVEQPDGTIWKELDEDMRQSVVLALIEAIPNFQMEEPPDA